MFIALHNESRICSFVHKSSLDNDFSRFFGMNFAHPRRGDFLMRQGFGHIRRPVRSLQGQMGQTDRLCRD